eukprot:1746520-Rhodomonas_salina.3
MVLSACAMPGTALAYGLICLRASYAVSGTDLAYAPTSWPAIGVHTHLYQGRRVASPLRSYALPTKCPVLRQGVCVPGEWST